MRTRIINYPVRRQWSIDDTVSVLCVVTMIGIVAWCAYMLGTIDERRVARDAQISADTIQCGQEELASDEKWQRLKSAMRSRQDEITELRALVEKAREVIGGEK